jgi:hypothetical protein
VLQIERNGYVLMTFDQHPEAQPGSTKVGAHRSDTISEEDEVVAARKTTVAHSRR